jgi:DNA-binding transcriptional ArsR family regulator
MPAAARVLTRRPGAAPHEPRLARVAAMIADASRSRMLAYLLDGSFASAGELARAASVSAATASAHLAQLLDGGLLVCEPRGRHRYYRLADGEVAQALSALALVAERGSHARAWASPERQRLRHARCCYGHLAGELGVRLMQALQQRGWLVADRDADAGGETGALALTEAGRQGLAVLGLDPALWQGSSPHQRLAYGCLDWSERRDHLAGRLGRALLSHALEQGWLRRHAGERALQLTPRGRQALAALLPGL